MRELVLPTNTVVTAARQRRASTITRLLQQVTLWLEVRRQRRQLMSMSDHMLHDLGLSRADAEGEAMRPFWDLPERWR